MKTECEDFSVRWALRQIDATRRMLKQLTAGTLLLWAHSDSTIPQVMYARIRPGVSPGTFDYEAIDTLSVDGQLWAYGSFKLSSSRLILLKQEGTGSEAKAFAALSRVIRRCIESPLVEGDLVARGAWCDEPSPGTDLTPLAALAMNFIGAAALNESGTETIH